MGFHGYWKSVFLFFYIYRESFPNDLQFTILMRFTVDQTQTPNLKVSSASVYVCAGVCMCVSYIWVDWVCSVLNKRHEAGGSGTVLLLLPCTYSPPEFPSVLGCDWIVVRSLFLLCYAGCSIQNILLLLLICPPLHFFKFSIVSSLDHHLLSVPQRSFF